MHSSSCNIMSNKSNNPWHLLLIRTLQQRYALWFLDCQHYLCLLHLMHPRLCNSFPVLYHSFFHIILGHDHPKPKYYRQEGGYHQALPFVFQPQPNFILVFPIYMLKYLLFKYALVLAKCYQGSYSYSHRYAHISAE